MILSSVADLSQADEETKKKLVKLARDDPAQAAKHVKLHYTPRKFSIDQADELGVTTLFIVAEALPKSRWAFDIMLELGADLTKVDRNNESVFTSAVRGGADLPTL